jgi:hypothetical protein
VKSIWSKFRVPTEEFPVSRQQFPVPPLREFGRKVLELLLELMRAKAKMAANFANSLLFSLFSGNWHLQMNRLIVGPPSR